MYGVMIVSGILLAAWYAESELKLRKLNTDVLWDLLLWILIFGIIGARLYHVIDYFTFYKENPDLILKVWNGGLGIIGGILGGLLGAGIYFKKHKISSKNISILLDIAAKSLPLGQFVGRWGNYFNQELYGLPTKAPWGIFIDYNKRPYEYLNFEKFHPLFLYESIINILIFFVLAYVSKKKLIPQGKLFFVYLILYSLVRIILEPLRINHWTLLNQNMLIIICILLTLVSGIILLKAKK